MGYSPWGSKESDMTEVTEYTRAHTHTHTHTHCCKEGSENKQQFPLLTRSIGEVSWFLTGGEGRGVSMSGAAGVA